MGSIGDYRTAVTKRFGGGADAIHCTSNSDGSGGGNSGNNTESVSPQCLAYGGTLGTLVQDGSGGQYILGDAHVLALSPTGYYASGSNIPIIQPNLGDAYPTFVSCPPTATQIAMITVATLTVIEVGLLDVRLGHQKGGGRSKL